MSFQDIKGQDRPIQIIKEHLRQSRLSRAYLFSGQEGIGKRLVAKTLAKVVNCQEGSIDSCDKCASCLKIDKNAHPDVHSIDTQDSDSIKIEYIRNLQREINLKPYEARLKVFIIDNAHSLTAEAENSILKVLEEPPANSLIILVSAKPMLLFKTIISRCQTIKFYPLAKTRLEEILKRDYCLGDTLAHFLAYFCEGRLGECLRLKDTDIIQEKNRIIDALSGLEKSGLDSITIQDRKQIRYYLNILAGWFRDIYLVKTGLSHQELINLDRKKELLRLMQNFSFSGLDEIFNSITSALSYLEQNVNIKLLLLTLREEISYGTQRTTVNSY